MPDECLEPLLESRLDGHIGTVVMNHPSRRNALSDALIKSMIQALHDLRDRAARVIVLKACESAKVWSAGHDVRELPMPGRDPLGYDDPLVTVLREIQHLPIPVIAMINGSVWGGACDLALTCDILIGSPKAQFTMTPAKIGVPYNPSGLLRFMNILPINVAKEMFFTAQPVCAARALEVGILNHLVEEDALERFTYEMAEGICRNSPLSISCMKESFRLLGNASPLPPNMFERIQGWRRRVYDSSDYKEGIQSFLEKRLPLFKGE